MSDIRVPGLPDPAVHVTQVTTNGQGGRHAPHDDQPREHREETRRGSEELAVALSDSGRSALSAEFTQDAEGNALIRIVDRERGDTVAVITPEELHDLAERTGLPPGLLVQAAS
jgi:hypothetical protein